MIAKSNRAPTRAERALDPERTYPFDEIMERFGLSRSTLRKAKARGLRVKYQLGQGWIQGRDFNEFIDKHGKSSYH